jgi:predicted aldo/keto reductase-like oxidoreductase
MQYRKLGKTGAIVSALGFGCMRFPILEEKYNMINKPEAEKMLLQAYDDGVNYFDTAYPYHRGESEIFLGEFIQKYNLRDKIYLATKLPCWKIEKKEDFETIFYEQIDKLQVDFVDFYLVHALNYHHWKKLIELGLLEFLHDLKKQTRITYVGFSFHDKFSLFRTIVNAYDWDFCQIQYNYVDTDYQAGEKGLKLAAKKDMGIIVMEPLRGGKLARNIPTEISKQFQAENPNRSPVDWAFRFLLANPSVNLILSGMSTMEQVEQNVAIFSESSNEELSPSEQKLFSEVRDIYKQRIKISCTGCRYCLPCPKNVSIPDVFELYNDAYIFNDFESAKKMYKAFIKVPASECFECGKCEKKCPQKIEIRKEMRKVSAFFDE